MWSYDQRDLTRPRFAGMKSIEIDDAIAVNLKSRTVVSDHLETISTGITNPESTVVVESDPLTSGGYVR